MGFLSSLGTQDGSPRPSSPTRHPRSQCTITYTWNIEAGRSRLCFQLGNLICKGKPSPPMAQGSNTADPHLKKCSLPPLLSASFCPSRVSCLCFPFLSQNACCQGVPGGIRMTLATSSTAHPGWDSPDSISTAAVPVLRLFWRKRRGEGGGRPHVLAKRAVSRTANSIEPSWPFPSLPWALAHAT